MPEAAKREAEKIQTDLFGPMNLPVPKHYDTLRVRYGTLARDLVNSLLTSKAELPYDVAWRAAVSFPLVWESDLKEWISGWREEGAVVVNGLGARERTPKLNAGHRLSFIPRDRRSSSPASGRKMKPSHKK